MTTVQHGMKWIPLLRNMGIVLMLISLVLVFYTFSGFSQDNSLPLQTGGQLLGLIPYIVCFLLILSTIQPNLRLGFIRKLAPGLFSGGRIFASEEYHRLFSVFCTMILAYTVYFLYTFTRGNFRVGGGINTSIRTRILQSRLDKKSKKKNTSAPITAETTELTSKVESELFTTSQPPPPPVANSRPNRSGRSSRTRFTEDFNCSHENCVSC